MEKNELYRKIPKVDVLLEGEVTEALVEEYGRDLVVEAIRKVSDDLRKEIGETRDPEKTSLRIDGIMSEISETLENWMKPDIRRVINGTGTILHTNLGRAPIGEKHMRQLAEIASHYSNLEYDLEKQARGERYSHFEELLCRITGAEAAMAVNNNAAAVMLILNTMGKDKEMIVSRGELVEIGGKFRVPDVMEQSGARLVEVGTTNKTHLQDYADAITEETAALMKVHTSNYRIVGFTESVPIGELVPLAAAHDLPVIEDLGSGVLIDLAKYGLEHEPTVQESVAAGADVVCFSGDKLLGGPQAGIIIGKKKYIDAMKKNQLIRALRIDKFTAAALEMVLREYLCEEKAIENLPVLRMITESGGSVNARSEKLAEGLKKVWGDKAEVEVQLCESQIGGGSLPLMRIPGTGVAIRPVNISVSEMETRMHHLDIPVIPRIHEDWILLDARTIREDEVELIIRELGSILK